MHLFHAFLAFSLTTSSTVLAKTSVTHFTHMNFTTATSGKKWLVRFTKGDGEPVTLSMGNDTWSYTIATGLAAPGKYPWNVTVPSGTVSGHYQLELIQGNATTKSDPFSLKVTAEYERLAAENANSDNTAQTSPVSGTFPSDSTITTAAPIIITTTTTIPSTITAIYLPQETTDASLPFNDQSNSSTTTNANTNSTTNISVTFIYYEDKCACHRTSSIAATDMPPSTDLSTTTTPITYTDARCGCTSSLSTALYAETVIPVTTTITRTCTTGCVASSTSAGGINGRPTYTGAAAVAARGVYGLTFDGVVAQIGNVFWVMVLALMV